METWKQAYCLPDYGGVIEVSDLGRVRVYGRKYRLRSRWGVTTEQSKPDRLLAGEIGSHGYRVVALYVQRKRHRFLVHRLVALAFVSGYFDGATVNHINGDKLDNRSKNLEWVSLAKNTELQWETGLIDLRGEKHPSSKLSPKKVLLIRQKLADGVSKRQIAREMGVSDSLIYKIQRGRAWLSV